MTTTWDVLVATAHRTVDRVVPGEGPVTRTELLLARLQAIDLAGWLRAMVALIAGFHALFAITLALAPEVQLVTAGTLPVLQLVPGASIWSHRLVWAVVYAIAAVLLTRMWRTANVVTQWSAWLVVIPVGFVWAGVFGIAVIDGAGSALGLVIWIILLLWWGLVAVAVGVTREPAPDGR